MSSKEFDDRAALVFLGMLAGIVLIQICIEYLSKDALFAFVLLIFVGYVYFSSRHYCYALISKERRNLARFAGFALIASALSLFWMMVLASHWDWLVFVVCHALYIFGLYLAYANDDGSTNYYVMATLVITAIIIGLGFAFGVPISPQVVTYGYF